MAGCLAIPRRRWNALFESWNRIWPAKKGSMSMPRRAGLDHNSVVEEAARLLNEESMEQLSLGRLAERLGVRTPSLYNHVPGLPGLKHDLALYCSRELLVRLTRATIGKAGQDAIFALANAYRDYAREAPAR